MSCSTETSKKTSPPSPSVKDRERRAAAAPPQNERRPARPAAGRRAAGCFGAVREAMARLALAAALLLAGLLALPALAQSGPLPDPVDPLKRSETTPGRLSVGVVLGYAPVSGNLFDVDDDGSPYTDTFAVHALTPSLTLKYAVNDRMTIGAGLSVRYQIEQILRHYTPSDVRYLEKGFLALLPRASLAYRLDPEGALDPTLSVTLYKPWAGDVSFSASLIRDPIVLSSSLSFAHGFMPPYPSSFSLSAGAGFVANDRISFALNAALVQPLSFAASPSLAADLSTSYNLDPETTRQLTVSLKGTVSGGSLGYGVRIGYALRELDPALWAAAVLGR